MKELVDGEKLKEEIFKWDTKRKPHPGGVSFRQELYDLLEICTLSPAELASILKGKAWVLEEAKRQVKEAMNSEFINDRTKDAMAWVYLMFGVLESQAPISELEQEDEENRQKARAWDMAKKERFVGPNEIARINELLAQSKKPPKAEEEENLKRKEK